MSWCDHGQFVTKSAWCESLSVSNTYRFVGNSLTSKNPNSPLCGLLDRANPGVWRDSYCDLTWRMALKVFISPMLRLWCCSSKTLLSNGFFPFLRLSVLRLRAWPSVVNWRGVVDWRSGVVDWRSGMVNVDNLFFYWTIRMGSKQLARSMPSPSQIINSGYCVFSKVVPSSTIHVLQKNFQMEPRDWLLYVFSRARRCSVSSLLSTAVSFHTQLEGYMMYDRKSLQELYTTGENQ